MKFKYIKTLKDNSAIDKFFSEHGVDMPQGFKEFFSKNNGGHPEPNEYTLDNGLERIVNNFLSFNEEDKENIYKAVNRVAEDNVRLIPFAKEPGGDYFCLLDGKVVIWSHEDGEILGVADSFEKFICVMDG